ncbi:MAG: hypothetical protein J7L26_09580 [Candidatus Aminicenantes bacterium]|nr:hypothetical protein [Candidatus Aminicenantes bacterium]
MGPYARVIPGQKKTPAEGQEIYITYEENDPWEKAKVIAIVIPYYPKIRLPFHKVYIFSSKLFPHSKFTVKLWEIGRFKEYLLTKEVYELLLDLEGKIVVRKGTNGKIEFLCRNLPRFIYEIEIRRKSAIESYIIDATSSTSYNLVTFASILYST